MKDSETEPHVTRVELNAPASVHVREQAHFQRTLNLIAAALIIVVAIVYLLLTFANVVQELLVALFVVYLLMPPYHWLVSRGVPRLPAGILLTAAILGGFGILGLLISGSIVDLETKLPHYQERLVRSIERVSSEYPWLGLDGPTLSERLHLQEGTQLLQTVLGTVSQFLSHLIVVVIYMLFMLAERGGLEQRIGLALDAERARTVLDMVHRINASITQYIVVKTLMSLLAAVLTWAVLAVFGVDYAVVWGLIAFLFNFIPYLGSIVATVLPVVLCLVQFEDPGKAITVLVLLLVIQNVIGYLIEPRLAGRRLDLRPIVIIVSLAFWGALWGIVGMLLAVPLMVVVKAILEEWPTTRPLARMLGN